MAGVFFVLNDGAYDEHASYEEVLNRLEILCKGLVAALSKDRRFALVGPSPFLFRPAPAVHMSEVLGKPENRDFKSLLLRLLSKYEFSYEDLVHLYDLQSVDLAWTYSGMVTEPIHLAVRAEAPLASLGLGHFHEPEVEARLARLDDSGELEQTDVVIRNVADPHHVAFHQDWFDRHPVEELTAVEIWSAREDLFPHLTFLPRTQKQLTQLGSEAFGAVLVRLRELEAATLAWDPSLNALPSWKSTVTPESESRMSLCWFDVGSTQQLFSLHARYTPGAGRIHLKPHAPDRKLTIAHVGVKLGI